VAYGSIISVKQQATLGQYLHSHPEIYPLEFGLQQQVLMHDFSLFSLFFFFLVLLLLISQPFYSSFYLFTFYVCLDSISGVLS
jgi:hypothetical protein